MPPPSRPPPPDAPVTVRLGWQFRIRRMKMPASREQVAEALNYSPDVVKRIENGTYGANLDGYMTRWATVYGVDEELRALWDRALGERQKPKGKRRPNGNLAHNRDDPALRDHHAYTPQVSDDEIAAAIAEARRLAPFMATVPLTALTLEELDRDVHELDAAWRRMPLPEIFRRARVLRNKVTACLNDDPTEGQQLQLLVLGGTLHAHLVEALLDLGYFTAAWSQTTAGLALAKAADASELRVLLHSQRSRIRYWQGIYDVAVSEAQTGAASVRPGSPAAVKLFDKLALAASRMGDTKQARRALHACEDARDAATGTSYLTPIGEEFCSMGAAYSLVVLGDLPAAQRHAQYAVSQYEARGTSSVNLMFARLGLAKAQPDPAAAAEIGTSAIEAYLAQHRRSQMIVVAARQLDAGLPDCVPEVEEFRERLHALEVSTRQLIPGV
jgi:hypothetical protein